MTGIARRTTALAGAASLVVLVVGGALLAALLARLLTARFDEALRARAAGLQALTSFDGARVDVEAGTGAAGSGPRESPGGHFVAWVKSGARWMELAQSESRRNDWTAEWAGAGGGPARDAPLPSGRLGRVVVIEFAVPREHDEDAGAEVKPSGSADSELGELPTVRIAAGMDRQELDGTIRTAALAVAGVGAAMGLAGLAALRWAVARGLRPVGEVSEQVRRLGPHTLSTRLHAETLPVELRVIAQQLNGLLSRLEEAFEREKRFAAAASHELRVIAQQLNGLLSRLEEAFEREKRFAAAASHELRTPIAELRVLLEVAASKPRTAEEWEATADRARTVLARMQALCVVLLHSARAEAGPRGGVGAACAEVGAVLAEQAAHAAERAGVDAALIRVEASPGPLSAAIEPAALETILANLLDNALRHGRTTAQRPVRARAGVDDGRVWVEIGNDAGDLNADDLSRLFEPFWRKDAARTDQRGFGLGLSVARALATDAGGELGARLEGPGRIAVRVELPTA